LGTSLGRGGATTAQQDLQNSDCILIMGSNMAECHPVGFQWVMEARERGAKVIHVDPRFTRTSAMADIHVPLRPGSDIAFLGGIVNYILENNREFRDYVVNYTNAPVLINKDFKDTEDLDGFFSGYDPEKNAYQFETWQYEDMPVHASAGQRKGGSAYGERHGGHGGSVGDGLKHGHAPHRDMSLQHPRCVFQILKRHFARYTPETVAQTCGIKAEQFLEVAQALCDNSGRERTSAMCYAVGWTHHTAGVQLIRTAAIIQLLLGNIGRPGGGILALRGHASIQGSTDIPTLYNLLPGYIPMPHATEHTSLQEFVQSDASNTGFWAHMEAYTVSLFKAWWGDHAQKENDFCFDYMPRISGSHSYYRTIFDMLDGTVHGYFVVGENPLVGSANAELHSKAFANLDWLVVRDLVEIETASFWYDSVPVKEGALSPEQIKTEVFLLPASAHTEKNGSFTNTQRLLQWHHKAVEPQGDARSELWFYYHLGKRIQEKLAHSTELRDRPIQHLAWNYPTEGPLAEPSADAVLREINGWDAEGKALGSYTDLKSDGSTTCGCWIYCGVYKDEKNHAASRKPRTEQNYLASEWGWAWPSNRHIIYNRASADPDGKPWSERKKLVWWDEAKGEWTGEDTPDFEKHKRPDYVPPEGAKAEDAIAGTSPFIMQDDGVAWLFVPNGLKDGPLPAHFEPQESPVENPLYGQQSNPIREQYPRPGNRYNPSPSDETGGAFPYVLTTYRLTEHHTGGGMSRTVPHLSELQPELFCEISPQLAKLRGLEHDGWATIFTERAMIEARVLVTDRVQPLHMDGKTIHQIGLPYHWGSKGIVTGDTVNDLLSIALDPNVHIQETKALTCDIRPGRRPRGPARKAFIDEVQAATLERTPS
jgi:formate dehydrogenase major subunit